jgi:MarR family transcriptional regulator, organic hydroperoxide resistance regulator
MGGDEDVTRTNGGFLISQVKQVQGRVFEHLLRQTGLDDFNGSQGRILYVLWQEDGLPIVDLSRRTGLAKTTLTSMLDRMEASGLLARRHDPDDRRQQRIVLTPKAKSLSEKYESVSQRMAELFYRGFQEPEILAFEQVLHRILENLEGAERASVNQKGTNP